MTDICEINVNKLIENKTNMELFRTTADVEVTPLHEENYTMINQAKFQNISEVDVINTDETINTDESLSVKKTSSDETINEKNNTDQYHEFSVSTLDRKLKEIHNTNIQKNVRHMSINSTNDDEFPLESHNRESNTIKSNAITLMLNPSKLINEHLSEIQLRIIGHKRSANMYKRREKIIGYPVTILSAFLTSTIMMSISNDNIVNEIILKYVSIILSILSFLFSVSRTYLDFAQKFQSHDLSSKLYTTILRSIEVRLIKNHINKEEKRDIFKDIVDQMSIIEQYETPIPDMIDNAVRFHNSIIFKVN